MFHTWKAWLHSRPWAFKQPENIRADLAQTAKMTLSALVFETPQGSGKMFWWPWSLHSIWKYKGDFCHGLLRPCMAIRNGCNTSFVILPLLPGSHCMPKALPSPWRHSSMTTPLMSMRVVLAVCSQGTHSHQKWLQCSFSLFTFTHALQGASWLPAWLNLEQGGGMNHLPSGIFLNQADSQIAQASIWALLRDAKRQVNEERCLMTPSWRSLSRRGQRTMQVPEPCLLSLLRWQVWTFWPWIPLVILASGHCACLPLSY